MFITKISIIVEGGKGGDGYNSYEHTTSDGSNGGNGGNGGSVYVTGTNDIYSLAQFKTEHHIKAADGKDGGPQNHQGGNGADMILMIPVGSILSYENSSYKYLVKDCTTKYKIAKGGKGGVGNQNQSQNKSKGSAATRGTKGDIRQFEVELKLIADLGLIGLPNAGKSSLLHELTHQKVKVAPYPFTTLEPNIGRVGSKQIADIPGLIEGASMGKGLGIDFLKHIEKVGLILHCLAADSVDIMTDYETVQVELRKFSPALLDKEKIILLTKCDTVSPIELKKKIKALRKYGCELLTVSIYDWDSIEMLKKRLL